MDFFEFNDYKLELKRPEILLVKEFEDIFALKWNSGEKGDSDGRKRSRALKAITYIYLTCDWKSPYSEYTEKERAEAALDDSKLDKSVLNDETFLAVKNKYIELQDTRLVKLLKSAYGAIDKLRLYFENIDLTETDPMTGKPIYSARDLMSNLSSMSKTIESLQHLEYMVKKEKEQDKGLRGQAEAGMFDN
jgi:hypothetical protein